MFDSIQSNTERVEAVLSLLRSRDRGDLATHQEISELIGLSPSDDRASEYYRIVKRARVRYRDEDHRQVEPEHGVGFRILTVNQTLTDYQKKQQRRAFRSIGRAVKAVKALPVDGLSMHQRRLRDVAIERAAEQRRLLASREAMKKSAAASFAVHPFRRPEPPAQPMAQPSA